MNLKAVSLTAVAVAAFTTPALAHHSFAMFDAEQTVTMQGTVKEFEWTNPHSWLRIMVRDAKTDQLLLWALELSSPVLVAPMVGITDAPTRAVVRELGAGLVSTEMVAAEAVVRSTDAAFTLLDFPSGVEPVAAQLVGADPAMMADAAQVCVARGAQLVDVNLGCPVPRVVNRGSGAALARDVAATARVLGAMVQAVRVPVTAKMRLGWDHSTINAPELARALADVGVAMVTVHGRTRCQKYEGAADWAAIGSTPWSAVCRAAPVIGLSQPAAATMAMASIGCALSSGRPGGRR